MRRLFLTRILLLFFCAMKLAAASPYVEIGTGMGSISNADPLTQLSIGPTGLGFVGSLNFYVPITPLRNVVHLDLGLQNRFTSVAGEFEAPHIITPNIAMRVEFWRFYAGAGYAPKVLVNLKPQQGAYSYFFEGGVIWRIVPEFQICATMALEYGRPSGGGISPSPSTEYGLRFRFPLDPKEYASARSADFDGHRYPFGIMK